MVDTKPEDTSSILGTIERNQKGDVRTTGVTQSDVWKDQRDQGRADSKAERDTETFYDPVTKTNRVYGWNPESKRFDRDMGQAKEAPALTPYQQERLRQGDQQNLLTQQKNASETYWESRKGGKSHTQAVVAGAGASGLSTTEVQKIVGDGKTSVQTQAATMPGTPSIVQEVNPGLMQEWLDEENR